MAETFIPASIIQAYTLAQAALHVRAGTTRTRPMPIGDMPEEHWDAINTGVFESTEEITNWKIWQVERLDEEDIFCACYVLRSEEHEGYLGIALTYHST